VLVGFARSAERLTGRSVRTVGITGGSLSPAWSRPVTCAATHRWRWTGAATGAVEGHQTQWFL